jgi:AcrR family transcriptional regulator
MSSKEADMSKLTKVALGDALRHELGYRRFDKITVKDLVERAQVNRQTFYYHFRDIYDLLEWVFAEDLAACQVEPLDLSNWTSQLRNIIDYIDKNRALATNIYASLDHDLIRKNLAEGIRPSIEEAIANEVGSEHPNNEDVFFAAKLTTWLVVEFLMEWMGTGFREDPYQTLEHVRHLFSTLMTGLLAAR